jgi:SCY1-like protein 1
MTLSKSSANTPTVLSPEPVSSFNDDAEEFADDWGGFGEEENKQEDDPWAPSAPTTSTSSTAFDDKGEPDFAGWLAAQSTAKKPTTKSLPKGLTKSSTGTSSKSTRPVIGGRSSTTGSATTRKVVAAPKKEIKKVEEPKKNEDEEEGWGDAW